MLFGVLGLMVLDLTGKVLNTRSGKNDADEYGVYKDGNGNYRLKQNGHWVVDTYNDYGEKIIKNVKSGATEINIDKIDREKRKEEAIKNENEFYLYWIERGCTGQKHHFGNDDIIGNRYKRTNEDNRFYVTRKINYRRKDLRDELVISFTGDFFMDMKYNICCPTKETEIKAREIYKDNYDEAMNFLIDSANEFIKFYLDMKSKPFVCDDKPIDLGACLDDKYKRASKSIKRRK